MAFTFSGLNFVGDVSAQAVFAPPIINYSLFTFGGNGYGSLGDGTTTNRSSPVQIGSPTTWSTISAKTHLSAAIDADGKLWTWGGNQVGCLGLGDPVGTDRSSPTQLGTLTNWLKISAGNYSAGAIKTNGTLWSWGGNGGKLGLGDTTDRSSPVQVGALTTWASVDIGSSTVAIKTDGTLWAWGPNGYGSLGQGNTTSTSSPVQVGAGTTWSTAVCGGFGHMHAIKTDGTLWAWGNNNRGQLGLNNLTNISSPVQVGTLTNWLKLSAGTYHNAAIKTDGTMWTWGFNYGRLGLGNGSHYSSPKQVGALTTWSNASAGSYGCAAIKTDSTLWTWSALNGQGDLGQGNTTDRSSPVQVGALTNWTQANMGTRHVVSLALYS